MTKNTFLLFLFVAIFTWTSCNTKSKYDQMVEEGLASGEHYDSLFLGISLGMTDSAFYTHCWQLNKQQLVYQGSGNMSVLYKLKEELKHAATMEFYPEFVAGKIAKMKAIIKYDGWSPWNEDMSNNELQEDVLQLFKNWYGDDFMEVKHPHNGVAYVKIQGNRRISIYVNDDTSVVVFFTDLAMESDLDTQELQD
ncbi:MAG: hypothetical protein OEX02_12130 [Cyclobacteriaceae bacterium]|nr:hypothetical protein [Cyclobacteriaceae bacterium]